ncbi:MAG: RluA family pseudouridine synthase [Opitutales bacterium]
MSDERPAFWQGLPLGREVKLLAVDANGLAAFTKPAGVLSHPNEPGEEERSLLQAAYALDGEYFRWADEAREEQRLWLLNRLDSATSGVILACADADLAAVMREQFRHKRVRKVYQALVFGRPQGQIELWRDRLAVQKQAGKIRTSTQQGNLPAECRMVLLRTRGGLSLVKLEPVTGRSHQLRVQCAKRGVPIVGDATYGDFARNRDFARRNGLKRMFLHSVETSFDYDFRGQSWHFDATAPLPLEFEKMLAAAGN